MRNKEKERVNSNLECTFNAYLSQIALNVLHNLTETLNLVKIFISEFEIKFTTGSIPNFLLDILI